ncbi:MAG: MoxR family ATPase [Fimbriimonadaceae bacterium]|nr:MoxR family ATPase [Fimbriimonadaceae bacterium]
MKGQEAAEWFRNTVSKVRTEIAKVIVGQDEVVEGVLVGLAANGHILLEGMPGLGKTLLVKTLGECLGLEVRRIQFTPDLMPADVTGTNVLASDDAGGRRFEFRPGPIFANLVLADEINRATPKTQSAMLEAMQERSITVGGHMHTLDEPFLVMATQNPVEQEGTYPLPEAQLDRFLLKVTVPFLDRGGLAEVVRRTTGTATSSASQVASREDVLQLREVVKEVPVADDVLQYALTLILATHPESKEAPDETKKYVRYGSSPRGAQAIVTTAKVYALMDGRYNVSKDDLKRAAMPALRHRILLNFEAEADGLNTDRIVRHVLLQADLADKDPIHA